MKFIITIILILKNVILFAQNYDSKRDYIWRTGSDNVPPVRVIRWDFGVNPTKIDSIHKKRSNFGQVGVISNTGGEFLLFSNGCYISDQHDSIINNTQQLNSGSIHNQYCPPNGSGYVASPMLILPIPSDTNTFALFHTHVSAAIDNRSDGLWVTQLKKNIQNNFTVLSLNTPLINDTLERGHLAACRHANGRDWWLIHPKNASNTYHKIFFSKNGFQKSSQSIGIASTDWEDGGGQALFSPNGTKYIRYNIQSDIRIFDFDRCTGQLSKPIQIPIRDAADTSGFAGCAISANSRYLYVISTNYVYQLDLEAPNVANSKITVLTYDNYIMPPNTSFRFSKGQLGLDGKIYITSNYRWFLHTIEVPDSAGVSCRAIQRSIQLPTTIYDILPYFPNFRLGALRGSPCDTLTATHDPLQAQGYNLRLFPNPANASFNVDITLPTFENQHSQIQIIDMLGKMVYQGALPPYTPLHSVDVSALSSGLYQVQLIVNGRIRATQKLSILR